MSGQLTRVSFGAAPRRHLLISTLFNNGSHLGISTHALPTLGGSLTADTRVRRDSLFCDFLAHRCIGLHGDGIPPTRALTVLGGGLDSVFRCNLCDHRDTTRPPHCNSRVRRHIALLVNCIRRMLKFALPRGLTGPLHGRFLTLVNCIQQKLVPRLCSSDLVLSHYGSRCSGTALLYHGVGRLLRVRYPTARII